MLKSGRLEYFEDERGEHRFRFLDPETGENLFGSHGGMASRQDVVDLVTAVFCQSWGPEQIHLEPSALELMEHFARYLLNSLEPKAEQAYERGDTFVTITTKQAQMILRVCTFVVELMAASSIMTEVRKEMDEVEARDAS